MQEMTLLYPFMVRNTLYHRKAWISSDSLYNIFPYFFFIVFLSTMINLYEYVSSYDFVEHITTSCIIISDNTPNTTFPDYITFLHISEIFSKDISQSTLPCFIISEYIGSEDYTALQKHLPS